MRFVPGRSVSVTSKRCSISAFAARPISMPLSQTVARVSRPAKTRSHWRETFEVSETSKVFVYHHS